MQGKRIGRILNSTDKHSRAELTEDAIEGMLISVSRQGYTFLGRIEKIESQKFGGLIGYIYWLDYLGRPFNTMTGRAHLHRRRPQKRSGNAAD